MGVTIIFAAIWGVVTAMLGVSWFDGDIVTAAWANCLPIAFVAWAESR